MNAHDCCRASLDREKNSRPAARGRRGREAAGWIFSGGLLVLMPKCPVCLAAYIAMFSGVGISVAGATVLRTSLIVMCIAALLFLAGKRFIPVLKNEFRNRRS